MCLKTKEILYYTNKLILKVKTRKHSRRRYCHEGAMGERQTESIPEAKPSGKVTLTVSWII